MVTMLAAMTPKAFGMRLRRERLRKKWTQADLAAQLGTTREYVTRLEGGVHDPLLSTVGRLAKILRISIMKLVK